MTPAEDQHDWNAITRRAVEYAQGRLGPRVPIHVAERLAHDALISLFKRSPPTDDESDDAIGYRLGSIINGNVQNYRRTKGACANDGFVEVAQHLAGRAAEEEGDGIDAEEAISRLLERIEPDELVTKIVMLHLDDIWKPKEIAEILGRDVAEIYNANRRLGDHYAAVRRSLGR